MDGGLATTAGATVKIKKSRSKAGSEKQGQITSINLKRVSGSVEYCIWNE